MGRKKAQVVSLLSAEKGAIRKKWKSRLPVALLFPNVYEVGMSNLGFQLVYDLVNSSDRFVCERIFYPAQDKQPVSVESERPLRDFSLILCSVSFEADFPNLVDMLHKGGIEPLSEKRRDRLLDSPGFPLVIGGGVAAMINPEPLAPFFDLLFIGEAEPVLQDLLDFIEERIGRVSREELLTDVAGSFDGCYVPGFYKTYYNPDGTIDRLESPEGIPQRIRTVRLDHVDTAGYSKIITENTEFSNMFIAELGRGCSRGCRFCAAGFVYRPPRLWSVEAIRHAVLCRSKEIDRVGLLGMEMLGGDDLKELSGYLNEEGVDLSFSSLRADMITSDFAALLNKSGLKTATVAPDGGSERLRRVINKNLSEEDLLAAAEKLVKAGIRNLKLYFMIGLPTESLEDIEEMMNLTLKIKSEILEVGRPRGWLCNLNLSINCFVPKAWTPFQYHPFEGVKSLKQKLGYLRKAVSRHPNLSMKADNPDRAYFQAMLARGDKKVGEGIGGLRSGKNWKQVFKQAGLRPDFYTSRARSREEVFPWDIIDHGISKEYLWKEYRKALDGKTTSACKTKECRRCGACRTAIEPS